MAHGIASSPTLGACTPPSCLRACSRALAMHLTPVPARSDMRGGPDAPISLSRVAHTLPPTAPPPEPLVFDLLRLTYASSHPDAGRLRMRPSVGLRSLSPRSASAPPPARQSKESTYPERTRNARPVRGQMHSTTGHSSMGSHRVGPQGGARGEGARLASSHPTPTLSRPAAQPRSAAAQLGTQPPSQGLRPPSKGVQPPSKRCPAATLDGQRALPRASL